MRFDSVLRWFSLILVIVFASFGAHAQAADTSILWDPATSRPARADIPMIDPVKRVIIHKAIENELQFLHGVCLVEHKGRIFASWTNGPKDEDPDQECVRGRWSDDGGLSWSDIDTVIADPTWAKSYGHGTVLSENNRLWIFVARFIRVPGKSEMSINTEAMLHNDATGKWENKGTVAEKFWPQDAPKQLPGGGWIVGGDVGTYPGEGPTTAIIDGADPTKWKVSPIAFTYDKQKDTKPPYAIETTLWSEPDQAVALMRNPYANVALESISRDKGQTWSAVSETNFAMAESRAFAGTLSTGQRYLVCNCDNRESLILAVSSPGKAELCKVWMVRTGPTQPRWPTDSKKSQWSYPWALEHDGKLLIAYSVAKEDC